MQRAGSPPLAVPRRRAKCAAVAALPDPRKPPSPPSNAGGARSSVMNTAAAAHSWRPAGRSTSLTSACSRESGRPRFRRFAQVAHQVTVHDVAGRSRLVVKARISRQRPMIGLAQRLRVERSQIGLDRAVQPVEHVVQPSHLGDAAGDRCRSASRTPAAWPPARRPCAAPRAPPPPSATAGVSSAAGRDRAAGGSSGTTRAGSNRAQQPRDRTQQRQEDQRQHQVERGVEVGDRARVVGLDGDDPRAQPGQHRQHRRRRRRSG